MSRLSQLTCAALLLVAAPALAGQGPTPAPSPQAPVQARPGGPESETPRTDQTVDVTSGMQLVLSSQAGEATIRAWDRDAVRVQARTAPASGSRSRPPTTPCGCGPAPPRDHAARPASSTTPSPCRGGCR